MKQVTIDTVRERIAELEMVHSHGELSLRGEFELACLRMLAASLTVKPELWEIENPGEGTYFVHDAPHDQDWRKDLIVQRWYAEPPVPQTGVDDDVRSMVALLENNEWAEHCTKTELGQRLEIEITRLVGSVQPVPVVSDADPSLNAMMRALDAFYADDDVPERAMLAAFRILLADVRNQVHQEPATDNTAQQFDAMATSGKSEHLLNAERIAREAQALADRLNATSAGSGKP